MSTFSSSFYSFFLISSIAIAAGVAGLPVGNSTHLSFYFHELFGATSFVVAGLPKNASTISVWDVFGDVRVFDNALTEGPELSGSAVIGRAQGMTVVDSLGSTALLTAMNFVFTTGEYNGSSLSVYGMSTSALEVNDHPIVGGSGKFRSAWGYALNRVITLNESYLLMQWDFYF